MLPELMIERNECPCKCVSGLQLEVLNIVQHLILPYYEKYLWLMGYIL
jgi:hypothetical protein